MSRGDEWHYERKRFRKGQGNAEKIVAAESRSVAREGYLANMYYEHCSELSRGEVKMRMIA